MSAANVLLGEKARKQLPFAAVATSVLIGLVNWQAGNTKISGLTDVRPSSSWIEWAYRWPGSFLKASPLIGTVGDTALSIGMVSATFAHTERDEGIKRTLKLAACGHALGCATTRLAAVAGAIPAEHMHDLDVGSSSAAAALAGNWATRSFREKHATAKARTLAMGLGAVGIGAVAVIDPSITDTVAHVAPYMFGVWQGGLKPTRNPETSML